MNETLSAELEQLMSRQPQSLQGIPDNRFKSPSAIAAFALSSTSANPFQFDSLATKMALSQAIHARHPTAVLAALHSTEGFFQQSQQHDAVALLTLLPSLAPPSQHARRAPPKASSVAAATAAAMAAAASMTPSMSNTSSGKPPSSDDRGSLDVEIPITPRNMELEWRCGQLCQHAQALIETWKAGQSSESLAELLEEARWHRKRKVGIASTTKTSTENKSRERKLQR
jgi:hypothetical protein